MNNYPEELRVAPVPLICLMGESGMQEKLLLNIKETARRGDKDNVNYKLFHDVSFDKIAEIFPVKKYITNASDSKSREIRIPAGILKHNWMKKQLQQVPSVLYALFMIDVRQSMIEWGGRETSILESVKILRSFQSNQGYYTKFIVIVIQKKLNNSSIGGEELRKLTEERINSLKRRTDLDNKQLLFMNEIDLSPSSVPLTRLGVMTQEMASEYFNDVIKHVKRHRKYLNKGSQMGLQIRHAFKTAYYYEFKKDSNKALQYYKSAYAFLTELANTLMAGDNSYGLFSSQEVKSVADWVNFKLCLYACGGDNLKDVVNQFRTHMLIFRDFTQGEGERMWKHYQWVCNQYRMFGELLEYMINEKKIDIATLNEYQRPVTYFHQAALFAIKRRESVQAKGFYNVKDIGKEESTVVLQASIFLGGEANVVSLALDKNDESLLLNRQSQEIKIESRVNHSEEVLYLLQKTYDRVNKNNVDGKGLYFYVICLIADEKFCMGNYNEVEVLLGSSIVKEYIESKWHVISGSLLTKLSFCAKKFLKLNSFLSYSFQLLSPNIPLMAKGPSKLDTHREIFDTLSNENEFAEAKKKWKETKESFVYEVPPRMAVITAKAFFNSHEAYVNDHASLIISLTSFFPETLAFSSIFIKFNNEDYNTLLNNDIVLNSQDEKFIEVKLNLTHFSSIDIQPTSIKLNFPVVDCPDLVLSMSITKSEFSLKNLHCSSSLHILKPPALMKIKNTHDAPNLVGEYQKLIYEIDSSDDSMKNCDIKFGTNPPSLNDKDPFLFFMDIKSGKIVPLTCVGDNMFSGPVIPNLEKNSKHEITIFIKSNKPDKRTVITMTEYDTSRAVRVSKITEISITSEHPIKSSFKFSSKVPHPISTSGLSKFSLGLNQVCVVSAELRCASSHSIQIQDIIFIPTSSSKYLEEPQGESVTVDMFQDSVYTVNTSLIPCELGSDICLAKLMVKWRRIDDASGESVTTILSHPAILVEQPPVTIKFETPNKATLGEPFQCALVLSNHTSRIQELNINIATESSFLFNGFQNANIILQPYKSVGQQFILVPTAPGFQLLPSLNITSQRYNKQLMHSEDNKSLFISPSNFM